MLTLCINRLSIVFKYVCRKITIHLIWSYMKEMLMLSHLCEEDDSGRAPPTWSTFELRKCMWLLLFSYKIQQKAFSKTAFLSQTRNSQIRRVNTAHKPQPTPVHTLLADGIHYGIQYVFCSKHNTQQQWHLVQYVVTSKRKFDFLLFFSNELHYIRLFSRTDVYSKVFNKCCASNMLI